MVQTPHHRRMIDAINKQFVFSIVGRGLRGITSQTSLLSDLLGRIEINQIA
jgi:hypothetical protein